MHRNELANQENTFAFKVNQRHENDRTLSEYYKIEEKFYLKQNVPIHRRSKYQIYQAEYVIDTKGKKANRMYELMFNGMVGNKVQKLTGWINKCDLINPVLRKMFKISRCSGIKPQVIVGKRYNARIDEIEYLVKLKNTKSKPHWYPEWKMMAFYHQVVEPYNDKHKGDSEEEKEYEVEKIVDKKLDAFNNVHYYVKWLGYSESENSWEPLENLQTSTTLIKQFENSLQNSKLNLSSNDIIYISDSDDSSIVQDDEISSNALFKCESERANKQDEMSNSKTKPIKLPNEVINVQTSSSQFQRSSELVNSVKLVFENEGVEKYDSIFVASAEKDKGLKKKLSGSCQNINKSQTKKSKIDEIKKNSENQNYMSSFDKSRQKNSSFKAYGNNSPQVTNKNIFSLMEDENDTSSKNKKSEIICNKQFPTSLINDSSISKVKNHHKNTSDLQQPHIVKLVKPQYDKAIIRGGFTDGVSKVLLIENPETGKLFRMSYAEAQLLYSTDFNQFFMSRKLLPF